MNNQTIDELKNRKFDSCFFSLICIPCQFYFDNGNNNINLKNLYLFFSCNLQGVRKFLMAVSPDDFEKISDWYNLIMSWKNRALEIILYATIPNNDLLKKALSLAFPNISTLYSFSESFFKIGKYYSIRYSSKLEEKIRKIYISESLIDYQVALDDFFLSFDDSIFLHDLLDKDFSLAKSNYNFDFLIRKHVLSFYFIREFSKKMWVASHSQPSFSSIDEYVSLLIPIIQTSEKKVYTSKSNWLSLINHIYPEKRELIKCYF